MPRQITHLLSDFRMTATAIAALAVVGLGGAYGLNAAERLFRPSISGKAFVTDGDTIRIGSERIRLQGIDAPELGTEWGERGRVQLIKVINSSTVTCRPDGTRTHGRIVAVCYRDSDGVDIGGEVILHGGALDCAHFSHGRYAALEQEWAKRALPRALYCGEPE
jgi:micrococcal nuclease